jgi:hypothetical protein
MSFTVHPAETQAMQEDETQLLHAIAQTTRSALGLLKTPPAQPQAESPEIRMNGRMIFGPIAGGQFRNELTAERLQGILDAMQQPPTEGVNPMHYKGKTPTLEIRDAGIILFRLEKDSIVSINQFQAQKQAEIPQQPEQSGPKPKSSGIEM